jgi:hypothetical protein
VKALFSDLSEHTRTWRERGRAHGANERRHVLALFDAIQVAVTKGQHDRVSMLLREMRTIVESSVARRNEMPRRISA